jgi:hypothetical protein
MDTIPRLIGYIEKAENMLREYEENGKMNDPLYKKLKKYRDYKKGLYDRIMKRKATWTPFGKATGDNNDCCTTYGDEVNMEMVNGNDTSEKKEKPHYFKFYDMNISDKMKEENHKRFLEHSGTFKTIKELYTNANGNTYYIYKTIQVETEKYSGKFKVPGNAKEIKTKRSLDDLVKEDTDGRSNSNSNSKSKSEMDSDSSKSKYVPPSFRNGGDDTPTSEDNRKLIVRNISREMMEDDIADIISTCGKLYDVRIHRDKFTGESKGFAFVKCETHETAKKIIETYNKKPIGHMIIRIDFAEDRNKKINR